MIKAKELEFVDGEAETPLGSYFIDFDDKNDFCAYLSDSRQKEIFWEKRFFKTEPAAKLACQAHYQKMAESMVDMDDLNFLFKNLDEARSIIAEVKSCDIKYYITYGQLLPDELRDRIQRFLKTLEK